VQAFNRYHYLLEDVNRNFGIFNRYQLSQILSGGLQHGEKIIV